MTLNHLRARLPIVSGWLLAGICFALPIQAAPVYVLSAFLLISWLLEPRFLERVLEIIRVKVNWAFVAYYLVFLVSMLWTEDDKWGWHMVGRQIPFLLFPLYWSVSTEGNRRRCISAFIFSIAMSVLLAHYNWLQMHVFTYWPEGLRVDKSPEDTAPFVDRIMYAPMLAFGAYFVAYRLLFEKKKLIWRLSYAGLLFLIITNLMLSGGRAGLVGFFALLVTLTVQRLPRHPIKAMILGMGLVFVVFATSYGVSDYLRKRVDSAVTEAMHPTTNINGAVGLRINFLLNSSRVFFENPLIGVGAGDFPAEYDIINKKYTPQAITTVNPHNQLMLILSSTGLFGAVSLVFLLFTTLGMALRYLGEIRHHLIAIWIGYAAICMFESYFWRSNTALTFCVLMALGTKSIYQNSLRTATE